ncbi:hypothetical protein MTR67_036110 [Solanum verrucosum]|uniref:RNase H type-1 domain-containing protein n=1 Tax=Solanum verrucosum TaxID=315347 RepID=A0AAF0ZM92_SOLVR|nr:hypothetical protein MTR67_036110 [Solanum verrucosum]
MSSCCGQLDDIYCRHLMAKLQVTRMEHVFREQNRVADRLSKEGVKNAAFDQQVNAADVIGTAYARIRNKPFGIFQVGM